MPNTASASKKRKRDHVDYTTGSDKLTVKLSAQDESEVGPILGAYLNRPLAISA
jgi:hypothetical protein